MRLREQGHYSLDASSALAGVCRHQLRRYADNVHKALWIGLVSGLYK